VDWKSDERGAACIYLRAGDGEVNDRSRGCCMVVEGWAVLEAV
jgi:hypothetical protein